jgi:hypothetical protein
MTGCPFDRMLQLLGLVVHLANCRYLLHHLNCMYHHQNHCLLQVITTPYHLMNIVLFLSGNGNHWTSVPDLAALDGIDETRLVVLHY